MPAGGIASAGIGALLGAGESVWGGIEKNKYQNQLNALSANRPQYQIQPEEYDIENQAASMANQGMGANARQSLTNNENNALAVGANGILMGGGNQNQIASLVDKADNSYNNTAIYDDQTRLQNLGNYQTALARMSADRDKQWQINTEQPWKDKMTALSGQLTGANNMFQSGLNMFGSQLGGLGKSLTGTVGTNNSGGATAGQSFGGGIGTTPAAQGLGSGMGLSSLNWGTP